jgi:mRNA-degrading endonuclease RelE of RelBE toxin-antitoxin system
VDVTVTDRAIRELSALTGEQLEHAREATARLQRESATAALRTLQPYREGLRMLREGGLRLLFAVDVELQRAVLVGVTRRQAAQATPAPRPPVGVGG